MAHMKFVHACGDKRDKRYYTRLWALHFAVEHIVTNPYLAMPKFITDQYEWKLNRIQVATISE